LFAAGWIASAVDAPLFIARPDFLSVRGFLDYAGLNQPLAFNVVVVLPSSSRNGVYFHRSSTFQGFNNIFTGNARRLRRKIPNPDGWLAVVDAFRTFCANPGPEGSALLSGVRKGI